MKPLTRRATAIFRSATPEQVEGGRVWYSEAHEVARRQVEEYGVTIEVASGVLAALSPRLGWGPNVRLADRLLANGGTLTGGCLRRSRDSAAAIYAGVEPLEILRGPKTRAFYQAILTEGQSPDAVIDRHAWDMLTGKRLAPSPTLRQYREAADRMNRAAEILGVGVHHVQATTWLAWRSQFWSAEAFALHSKAMPEGAVA